MLREIRWYFVPEDSAYLPYENTFTPRTWYDGSSEPWPLLGEVEGAPRLWVSGAPPANMGPNSCQLDPSMFVEGARFAQADALPHTAEGVLLCCITEVPPVAVDDVFSAAGTIHVDPHTGHVLIDIELGHSNVWTALQTFRPSVSSGVAVKVKGLTGQSGLLLAVTDDSDNELFSVDPDGVARADGGLDTVGITGGRNPLQVLDTGAAVQFAIDPDGAILTNQFDATAALPPLSGRLPVYDVAGNQLGFVPVYTEPPPPTTLILDSFTDTDGTGLDAHTIAPTNVPGTSWTELSGTWEIQSNAAEKTATTLTEQFATCDAGDADVTVSATVTFTAGAAASIVVRATDANNLWLIEYYLVSTTLYLYELNGGSYTLRDSQSAGLGAGTYEIKVVCNGTTISATIDGGSEVSYSSATFQQTATLHGLGSYNTGQSFDDFKVTTP